MKRFIINNSLKNEIVNSTYSIRKLSNLLGFEVKNITNKNNTISEAHLIKLESILKREFNLEEINLNYQKNLGKYAKSENYRLPNLPEKSEFLAELIGIMLGDGNLYKNRIRICCDKRDKEYIRYLKKIVKDLFKIMLREEIYKKTNQAYLYYYNQDLVNEFVKFGLLRGDKIKQQVTIPSWVKEDENYSKRCIKGLIDTDGCVYRCKREKSIYIKFTNFNKTLLSDFKILTKKLGYSFAKANSKNVCLYRKDEVKKFINDVKPFRAIGIVV